MKNLIFILSMLFAAAVILSTPHYPVFAAEGAGEIWDGLLKITEKCTENVSYSMTTRSKVNGKEVSTKMDFYFKNVKNYRVDTLIEGKKTRMVLTDNAAWVYLEEQNVITNMDHSSIESINIRESLEKQKETADVTEGKDGNDITYTIAERETKNKTVFTIDVKAGAYKKMQVYDAQGQLITEAEYTGWKFGPINDDVFKKPEKAKEMTMPSGKKMDIKK